MTTTRSTLNEWSKSNPSSTSPSDLEHHSRLSDGDINIDGDINGDGDIDSGDDLTKTNGSTGELSGHHRRRRPRNSATSINEASTTTSSSRRRSEHHTKQTAYFSTGRDFYDDGYYGSAISTATRGSNKSPQTPTEHRHRVVGGSGCGSGSGKVGDDATASSLGVGDADADADADRNSEYGFHDDEEEASIDDRLDFSPRLWGREQDLYKLLHIYNQIRAGPPPQALVNTTNTTSNTTTTLTTNTSSRNLISSSSFGLACHTVMIRGVSGTGKSTLVQQFYTILQQYQGNYAEDTSHSISTSNIRHNPKPNPNNNSKIGTDTTERDGTNKSGDYPSSSSNVPFFLTGKYNDEFSGGAGCQNNPLSAIEEAFSEFCQNLLLTLDGDDGGNQDTEFNRVQKRIQQALGPEAQELLEGLIPGLSPLFRREKEHDDNDDDQYLVGLNDETIATSPPSAMPNVVSRKTSILSAPPAMSSTSSVNALNQLKYIFATFCNAISSKERPVILFLDDLQWCDAASVELLQSMLTDRSLQYFMFIGAYRSDEVEEGLASPEFIEMLKVLDDMTDHSAIGSELLFNNYVEYIEVYNLTFQELSSFVGGAMRIDRLEDASEEENRTILELATIIYGKTSGNIFFSKQILEQLHREGYIEFSRLTFLWECRLEGKDDLDALLSDDVLKTVTTKIQNAPADLQRVLVVAAYTRSTVDIDILWRLLLKDSEMKKYDLSNLSKLTKILDDAVLEGLFTNTMGSKNYCFAHDRIQQAAFALIPKGPERDQFRLDIGMNLLQIARKAKNLSEVEWMLFAAADHMNAASFLYRVHHDPMILTSLNLEVGELAANKVAYDTASKYLMLVMQDLNSMSNGNNTTPDGNSRGNPWESHYEVTLQTYRLLADVQLRQGRYETGAGFGNSVLRNARCLEDRLPTQLAMTNAFGRQEEHKDSLTMATRALRELHLYPRGTVGLHCSLVKNLVYVKRYFQKNNDTQFRNLPRMTDTHTLITMDFLSSHAYRNYILGSTVGFLADTLMMLGLTIKHGICGFTGVALTGYALFCNNLNDMEGAYRFSDLARRVLEDTRAKELECLQLFVVAHWIISWKEPHVKVLQCFDRAFKSGMETGDYENAFLSRTAGYHHEYTSGSNLGPLDEKYCELVRKLETYKIKSILVMTVEQRRKVQHLKGDVVPPLDVEELSKFGPVKHEKSEMYGLLYGYLCRLELAVYFGHLPFAEDMTKKLIAISDFDKSYTTNSLRLYFICITFTSLARSRKKRSYVRKAKRFLKDLTNLCNIKGMNSWHKCLILEAHLKSATGWGESRVEAGYDLAIQTSLNSGYQQDAALACQLAGEYFSSLPSSGKIEKQPSVVLSQKYLNMARSLYKQWGAYAMVKHLENKYTSFFNDTGAAQGEEAAKVITGVSNSFREQSSPIEGEGLVSGILTTHSDKNDEVSVITELTHWRREPVFVTAAATTSSTSSFSASIPLPNEEDSWANPPKL
jgi:predicted ATPase